jgi:threonine dehydratase
LAGIEVPLAERPEFEAYLDALGYPYVDETNNPAYQLFLK